jgi:hypothetical protein
MFNVLLKMYSTVFSFFTYIACLQVVAESTMESSYYIYIVWFTFRSNLAVPNHEIDEDCI